VIGLAVLVHVQAKRHRRQAYEHECDKRPSQAREWETTNVHAGDYRHRQGKLARESHSPQVAGSLDNGYSGQQVGQ
jgi:hypothetical protein